MHSSPLDPELVDAPEAPVPEPVETVPVFRTTSATVLPVVTSLLDSAGVEYFVQGEEALALLPVGAMGSHVSRASLGAIVHVAKEDAESVEQLLSELEREHRQADPVLRHGQQRQAGRDLRRRR